MAAIERLRVAGEQPLHDRGEGDRPHSYRDMKAIASEAKGEEFRSRFSRYAQEILLECRAVLVVHKNIPSVHPVSHRMIDRSGTMNSLRPFHAYHTIEPLKKFHERN